MSTTGIYVGAKVFTHSLVSADYNYLWGTVMGPEFNKNGVMRVPVCLKLADGSKKVMSLPTNNLKTPRRAAQKV